MRSSRARWAVIASVALAAGVTAIGLASWSVVQERRGAAYQPWEPPIDPAAAHSATPRAPCTSHTPLRQAFFGDLHVHTTYSYDSASRDVRVTPDGAYRFATGESAALPPNAADGLGTRQVQLARPLDFAAVTDHAEWLAETGLCMTPGSSAYEDWLCRAYRNETWLGRVGVVAFIVAVRLGERRNAALCGEDGARCRVATLDRWRLTQEAAERWYDRSSRCRFTTFHGYEYSRRDDAFMMHRNVLFRNEIVPELPLSWVETNEIEDLWRGLDELCNSAGGDCEAIAIPHNTNHSSGRAFALPYRDAPLEEQRERAALRAAFEPLVELVQVKGESECRNGLAGVGGGSDEFCAFEKIFPETGEDALPQCDRNTSRTQRCAGPLSFARYGLAEGLGEADRIGTNPLAYGWIGSTDTHNGTPGDTGEASFDGSTGRASATPEQRLSSGSLLQASNITRNPGGLAGIWAEENSRDALFDAMQRRETFATSGPRIRPRLFAGPQIPENFCSSSNHAVTGYLNGVPMGGVVRNASAEQPPRFAVLALRDPGTAEHPGTPLERVQIVKVWSEGPGRYGQAVYPVAGHAQTRGAVDLNTCEVTSTGSDELCATWIDPDYDPAQRAAYYARVLEEPSCRWSHWECLRLPADERQPACEAPNIPKTIQERAWTSPIWVAPAKSEPPA